jgi:tRNA dimethylallyltransferase
MTDVPPDEPAPDAAASPSSNDTYPLIAIGGPTASGKSALAMALADAFDGEIVNYDSIQLYRRFDIGTAKPPPVDRQRVPHHLIDVLDPGVVSTAGDYQRMARDVLSDIRGRHRRPILVGGTGLYLKAALEGLFAGPQRSALWRTRFDEIAHRRCPSYLHRILSRLDPDSASRIAPADTAKVIRALEVRLESGRRLSDHLGGAARDPLTGFATLLIGLDPPRPALYGRIMLRTKKMFDDGLVDEVRSILEAGVGTDVPPFQAIGYRHVLEYIHGNLPRDEAIMLTERDTRRYAKRQWTWFRKQHNPEWFEGFGDDPNVQARVRDWIREQIDDPEIRSEQTL